MKPLRLNKVIGLSLGEGSLLAAEVTATEKGGGAPEVRQWAEMRYPDGVTPANPAELGAALAAFLREQKFTARQAVVGLPAKWLIVKPKSVPPADPTTLAELLRLQAEGEFSAELRDLTFDYAADTSAGHPSTVLLVATPQRHVDAAVALCEAAKLSAVAVTSSAVALGVATAAGAKGDSPIVMAVGASGAELTSQSGGAPSAIRHLRTPAGGEPVGENKPFLGELRRAVSTLPTAADGTRSIVLWGASADAVALGNGLGVPVRAGEIRSLGVNPNGAAGDGQPFAAAVALAVLATGDRLLAVDFLHSRLAPPPVRRVPRWAIAAAAAVLVVIVGSVYAVHKLQTGQAELDTKTRQLANTDDAAKKAAAFVEMVSFAKQWRGGDPRYLSCLRDLTVSLPQDGRTYVTNLTLHDPPKPTGVAAAQAPKVPDDGTLTARLEARTSDLLTAQQVADKLKSLPGFKNVKPGGSTFVNSTGPGNTRTTEVSFSVNFDYTPTKSPAKVAATSAGAMPDSSPTASIK